jgi:hypothetical protein
MVRQADRAAMKRWITATPFPLGHSRQRRIGHGTSSRGGERYARNRIVPLSLTLSIGAVTVVTFMMSLLFPEGGGTDWWRERRRDPARFVEAVLGSALLAASAGSTILVPGWYCVRDPEVARMIPLAAAGMMAVVELAVALGLLNGLRIARTGFALALPAAIAGALVAGTTSGAPLWSIAVAAGIWLLGLPLLRRSAGPAQPAVQ